MYPLHSEVSNDLMSSVHKQKLSEMESKDVGCPILWILRSLTSILLQIIITTYQTLNMDFGVPKDIESHEEQEWLAQYG